jgi:alginate O-acetyltransferase complex protein AlgJ
MSHSVSAICFLLFLIGATTFSGFTLLQPETPWEVSSTSTSEIMRGETSSDLEAQIDDNFTYKDHFTGLWGALRYRLFNTGAPGVVIGEDGWLFSKEEFEVSPGSAEKIQAASERMKEVVAQLQAQNIAVVIGWIPAKARFHFDKLGGKQQPLLQRQVLPPRGLPLVEVDGAFRSLNQPAFMRTDTHWSTDGAKAMAEAIAAFINEHYPKLTLAEKKFVSQAGQNKSYEGDLTRFVPTGFFAGVPAEETIAYSSENQSQEKTLSLFGDEILEVTLIGTSYSAQEDWHFEGFLKQALQSDVLNLADEGKGPFAPMDQYLKQLASNELTPPKLVIWEFPERYLLQGYSPEEEGAK